MIISLRGTNGAGKSTIVRKILNSYPTVRAIFHPGIKKRKPIGYICESDIKRLFVLGHYEIPNGGIDTIGKLDVVYEWILKMHEFGCDVIYEGMNTKDGVASVIMMHRTDLDVRVIFIDHPIQSCVKAVNGRGHKIPPRTITSLWNRCINQRLRLKKEGVHCLYLEREAALLQIQNWLGINHENNQSAKCLPSVTANNRLYV